MYTHPDTAASLARARHRDMRANIGSHRLARLLEDATVPETKETAMRKVLPYALVLPLIVVCTAAICSCSSNSTSAVGPTVPPVTTPAPGPTDPTSPAAGLLAYVPASLQSSCTDTWRNRSLPGADLRLCRFAGVRHRPGIRD